MSYYAKVIADSLSPACVRLTTLELRYPRFIHSEMLRHRMFSHSVMSSRAVPPEKYIEMVEHEPFVPHFNKRIRGMGVGEQLPGSEQRRAMLVWMEARDDAVKQARRLLKLDVDKSRVNRLLEPFLWLTEIVTATEWDNFFALRDNPAAQPEFQHLARLMREALAISQPAELHHGEYHLPYITASELVAVCKDWTGEMRKGACLVSARRCARISFGKMDPEQWTVSIDKAKGLLAQGHLSPFEHVARPVDASTPSAFFVGNFRGWVQFRKEIPHEYNFAKLQGAKP